MSSESSGSVCRRAIYHGHVHGVGFRWTAARVARRHAVRGYVRNLRDGTVELVAAGDESEVSAFLSDVASAMAGNISRTEVTDHSPAADFSGFEIRH